MSQASSSQNVASPAADTPSGQPTAAQPPTRAEAEAARKDRTLAEFMLMLDDHEPLVRMPGL